MKLKSRTYALVALFCLMLSTTSCMNLLERIFFNSNGGGTYSFTIDMSEMKSMMEMMGTEMSTEDLLKELDLDNTDADEKLKAVKGISNVALTFDSVKFSVGLKFDFADLNALNQGISTYFKDSTKTGDQMYDFFEEKGGSIIRSNVNLIGENFDKAMNETENPEDLEMAKMFLGDMYYSSELIFDSKIRSFSNNQYEQYNEKSITWKKYFFRDDDTSTNIAVKVKVK